MCLGPSLQDAVLLLRAVDQRLGVDVQHVALDVVQVERGQWAATHHAHQPALLRLVLHEELLSEPGVERVVQVALQGPGRGPGELLLLLEGGRCMGRWGGGPGLEFGGHHTIGFPCGKRWRGDMQLKCMLM